MTKDDILIVKPPYHLSNKFAKDVHDQLVKQRESGIIILPCNWSVEVAPSDVKIKPEDTDPETPWKFVYNPNHSSFETRSKEHNLLCTECGENIKDYWDHNYLYCPYCGNKHYFFDEEVKDESKSHL